MKESRKCEGSEGDLAFSALFCNGQSICSSSETRTATVSRNSENIQNKDTAKY